MSIAYYIASNKELPLGSSGTKRVDIKKETKVIRFLNHQVPKQEEDFKKAIDLSDIEDDEIEIYNSMEDIAGIYVKNIGAEYREVLNRHFKNSFMYEVSPLWGKFFLNDNMKDYDIEWYKTCKKCIDELFKYIEKNLDDGEEIEIYACWIGEECEDRNKNLDRIIDLSKFKLEDEFDIEEKQYIRVKK